MPTSTRSRLPKVGQEVTLKARVTKIDDSLKGMERVTLKVPGYEYPITLYWMALEREE